MILTDTSLLIDMLRDASGRFRTKVLEIVPDENIVLSRVTQAELLQGARDEADWGRLTVFLKEQTFIEAEPATWTDAARIQFELRRSGKTVRSLIDCVIAQLAIENEMLLLHNDRDFETIANIRPLQHRRVSA